MVGRETAGGSVKVLLTVLGSIALALGILGIFLPLLPSTPLFLLAAICYARSSRKLHDRLLAHPVVGRSIRSYRDGLGLPLRQKVIILVLLWSSITVSGIFFTSSLWIRGLLAVIAVGVTVHILMLPVRRD